MRIFVRAAILLVLGVTTAEAAILTTSGVTISRIGAGVSGSAFLFMPANVLGQCNHDVYGISFGVLYIANDRLYSLLLAAKNAGKTIRLLIVKDDAPPVNIEWIGSTTCRVEYADVE